MRPPREAIVLAGGFGTRLAHVVPELCKPMAPVAGRPFLRFVMDQLAAAKFDLAVIADGYRREQIESFFGSFYRGVDIAYSPEDEPLYTGGAVKQALSRCSLKWVFVFNGDTYCDADFEAMERAAAEASEETMAVIAVKEMRAFDRYGTVNVDGMGRILAFNEKAPCTVGVINAGVYLIRRDALDAMPRRFSLERDFFEACVGGDALLAVEAAGEFIDIGVPEDYERAQELLAPLARRWRLALFDRDGTINVDTGHLFEPERLELIPESIDLLRYYAEDPDFKVAVVTNQAGIARGLYSEADMRALHRVLDERLEALGCRIDAYYFCPHHPDFTGPCGCRKPEPGMLLAAMHDFDAEPTDCVMYGDKDSDRDASIVSGVPFCFVRDMRNLDDRSSE